MTDDEAHRQLWAGKRSMDSLGKWHTLYSPTHTKGGYEEYVWDQTNPGWICRRFVPLSPLELFGTGLRG